MQHIELILDVSFEETQEIEDHGAGHLAVEYLIDRETQTAVIGRHHDLVDLEFEDHVHQRTIVVQPAFLAMLVSDRSHARNRQRGNPG